MSLWSPNQRGLQGAWGKRSFDLCPPGCIQGLPPPSRICLGFLREQPLSISTPAAALGSVGIRGSPSCQPQSPHGPGGIGETES